MFWNIIVELCIDSLSLGDECREKIVGCAADLQLESRLPWVVMILKLNLGQADTAVNVCSVWNWCSLQGLGLPGNAFKIAAVLEAVQKCSRRQFHSQHWVVCVVRPPAVKTLMNKIQKL